MFHGVMGGGRPGGAVDTTNRRVVAFNATRTAGGRASEEFSAVGSGPDPALGWQLPASFSMPEAFASVVPDGAGGGGVG